MITGINYLSIFSVMVTDWETNITDLQANESVIFAKIILETF